MKKVKVNSIIKPETIEQYGDYIWIRKNIEEKEIIEEETTYTAYFYDEILLKNADLNFVKNNFDDIFLNPENYSDYIIQINGEYISERR